MVSSYKAAWYGSEDKGTVDTEEVCKGLKSARLDSCQEGPPIRNATIYSGAEWWVLVFPPCSPG